MCGIAGIISNGEKIIRLSAMLNEQRHRGPDAIDTYLDESYCALGHNRLSIIDLTTHANQPMKDSSGRYFIVFNGEIYNYLELRRQLQGEYTFRTQSDTEVLLAAYCVWGELCLPKLIGMFSFSIWDSKEKTLFAARDRFGVKPFYYTTDSSELLFSSEIKSLWAGGVVKQPNASVWASYFAHGAYGLPHETFWQGIAQLPGGYCLKYTLEHGMEVSRWYNFEENIRLYPDTANNEKQTFYENLIKESVALRFRSDVPVGFNLSGGLDSSTLLAIVDTLSAGQNIQAFTFTSGHEAYDELPWVQKLLERSSHKLINCALKSADVPALAQKLTQFQDEPYGGVPTIAYSNIFKAARERGVIVLLDGQGMDEAWAGYDYYVKQGSSLVQGSTSSPVRPGCFDPAFLELAEKHTYPEPFDNKLQNMQYRDIFYTKIPRALRFNDRISMMHSTELREPFLDHRMVEFAFAQPATFKLKDGQQKWMLREIAAKFLDRELTMAPKRPVQTPQREWLVGELKDWTTSMIEKAMNNSWSDRAVMKKEWESFCEGKSDNSFYVWQWITIAMLLS